jgi:hypothetical protein
MPSAGSSRAEARPANFAGDRADLGGQPRGAPLVTVQDARDLLAERLPRAPRDRAAHPADPHLHQDSAAAGRHVRHRALPVLVHAGRFRAARWAGHRLVPGSRTDADHLTCVLNILDDQRRQPREHSPHKLCHVNHD